MLYCWWDCITWDCITWFTHVMLYKDTLAIIKFCSFLCITFSFQNIKFWNSLFWGEIFKSCRFIFIIKLLSPLWKRHIALFQVWLNLVQWFCNTRMKMWKVYDNEENDIFWSEKLTWAFSSDDLKNYPNTGSLAMLNSASVTDANT